MAAPPLLLRQLPACSLPRALTSASASTSSCKPVAWGAGSRRDRSSSSGGWRQRGGTLLARITGTRQEYNLEGMIDPEEIWGEDAETEFIEVDNMPIWSPERGPVHHRIFRDADEEKDTKEISIEDTAYWFAENNEGAGPRTTMLKALPEIPPRTADEMLHLEEVEGCPPRLKLSDLEEGDELFGIVTDMWLWHGAFIDVMADIKGLVPIRQREWLLPDVQSQLEPGTEVVVRVHKISEYPLYRFPLQLELVEPASVVPLIMAPHEYNVPANVGWCYEQGMDIKQVTSLLGRDYEDHEVLLEPDHAAWASTLQNRFGFEGTDGERYPGDWLSRELDQPGVVDCLQDDAVDTASEGAF